MKIICPWCGNEIDDTPEEIQFFQNVAAVDCAECGKPVIVRRVFSVSYSAEKDN